jgi:phospholipid N-methyltransferase
MQASPIPPETSPTPAADFFRAFLKNWKEVGWPFQTSRDATKRICGAINFQQARRVVEIGAGTGNVTREVLKYLAPDGELIVFEVNSKLCRYLREIDDRRLVVYNASAFDMTEMVSEKADYIISALPIAMLSNASFIRFHQGVGAVLKDDGHYIQLQLSLFSYPSLRQLFRTVDVSLCLRNFLPLFIYRCKGLKGPPIASNSA